MAIKVGVLEALACMWNWRINVHDNQKYSEVFVMWHFRKFYEMAGTERELKEFGAGRTGAAQNSEMFSFSLVKYQGCKHV
jgi:hypothetical protein